jgi:hypothetical protein
VSGTVQGVQVPYGRTIDMAAYNAVELPENWRQVNELTRRLSARSTKTSVSSPRFSAYWSKRYSLWYELRIPTQGAIALRTYPKCRHQGKQHHAHY